MDAARGIGFHVNKSHESVPEQRGHCAPPDGLHLSCLLSIIHIVSKIQIEEGAICERLSV